MAHDDRSVSPGRAKAAKITRRAHVVGNSIVITLAPPLAEQFQAADPTTFFEQVATSEGILLRPLRLVA